MLSPIALEHLEPTDDDDQCATIVDDLVATDIFFSVQSGMSTTTADIDVWAWYVMDDVYGLI